MNTPRTRYARYARYPRYLWIWPATTLAVLASVAPGQDGDCNANGLPDSIDLAPTPQFSPTAYAVDDLPHSITATAIDAGGTRVPLDVNGDGHTDLAVDHHSPTGITVLLNDGLCNFPFSAFFPVGINGSWSVVAGDLDADGDHDLLAINADDNAVFVLLNSGLGAFVIDGSYATGFPPASGALGDFDEDGDLDLAVTSLGSQNGTVGVMMNAGDGTFDPPDLYPVPVAGNIIEAGDVDGDGDLDLALDADDEVLVLLNFNATGQFPFSGQFAAGVHLRSITLVDIESDGDLDIAGASPTDEAISILRNIGGGLFAAPEIYPTGREVAWIAGGDLDGDGDVDLAAAEQYTDDPHVVVLRNAGAGLFAGPIEVPAGTAEAHSITMGDFQGDGIMDLAVVDDAQDAVLVLHNEPLDPYSTDCNANGRPDDCDVSPELGFASAAFPGGFVQEHLDHGDIDGDGDEDLVVAIHGNDEVAVLINAGDGTFAAPPIIVFAGADTGPWDVALADLDGDGDLDIASANILPQFVSIIRNEGGGVFATPQMVSVGSAQEAIVASDIDLDGDVDLLTAVQNDTITVLINDGSGTFSTTSLPAGPWVTSVAVADLNGDALPDVVTTNRTGGTITVFLATTPGDFVLPGITTPMAGSPEDVVASDLDGDGHLDLAVVSGGFGNDSSVSTLMNDGNGVFQTASTMAVGEGAFSIAAGDLDGDGDHDLAFTNLQSTKLSVLLNAGGGLLGQPIDFETGGPIGVIAADLDGDGRLDLATSNFDDVTILLNVSLPAESADCNGNGTPDECDIADGASDDADGNGIPDECMPPQPCTADVTGDGTIDVQDLVEVVLSWGQCGPPCPADINQDGFVDVEDLVAVVLGWGEC